MISEKSAKLGAASLYDSMSTFSHSLSIYYAFIVFSNMVSGGRTLLIKRFLL